ncbi:MAG TPA: hypothetical protein VLH08_20720 [Acidobacteriota bacterium]|nr:hypothetical protein [Acidobacteriota bacterium]
MIIVLLLSQVSAAQQYRFEVPEVLLEMRIEKDSSVELYYQIVFRNQPGAHPIDFVDIGLPKTDLNFKVIETGCDGERAASFGPSEYVHPGIAVGLRNPIPPEGTGKFYFRLKIYNNMVYEDTTREGYASFQMTPTWFGSEYVVGTSDVTIRIMLPEGIQLDEVLSQNVNFSNKEMVEGHPVVTWTQNYPFTFRNDIGVSFPSKNMTGVIKFSIWDLIVRWYEANSRIFDPILGTLGLFLLAWTVIRAGGWGCLRGLIFLGIVYLGLYQFFGKGCIFFVTLIAAAVVEIIRRKRRPSYLKAIVSVEGGGVKRGLTAPEAGLLLELPPNKVITLILFGLLKKGFIRQKTADPLEFEVITAQEDQSVLNPYEVDTLKILKKPVKEISFDSVIKRLANGLTTKLKGHDLDETRSYYKHIVKRAWLEAKEVGDVQTWNKKMDEKIDWMMLDNDFEDRFKPYNNRYTPRYSFPSSTSTMGSSGSRPSSSSSPGPSITGIAGSMAGWMQNTAGSVTSSLMPQSTPLFDGAKLFKSTGGSSRSGGGGGGGCACACAGCACACACAGGGR